MKKVIYICDSCHKDIITLLLTRWESEFNPLVAFGSREFCHECSPHDLMTVLSKREFIKSEDDYLIKAYGEPIAPIVVGDTQPR